MKREEFDQMFESQDPEAHSLRHDLHRGNLYPRKQWFKRIFILAVFFLFGGALINIPQIKNTEKPITLSQNGVVTSERTPAKIEKMLFGNKGQQQTTVYVKKQSGPLPPMPPPPPDGPVNNSLFLEPGRLVRNYDLPEDSQYEYETIDTKTGRILNRKFKEHIHPSYEYDDWTKMLADTHYPMTEITYLPEGLLDEKVRLYTHYGKRTKLTYRISNPNNRQFLDLKVVWHNPEGDYQVAENYIVEIAVKDILFTNGLEGVLVEFINQDAFEIICLYNHVEYELYTNDVSMEEIIKFMEGIRPVPAPDPSLFEIPEKYRDEIDNLKWSISDE